LNGVIFGQFFIEKFDHRGVDFVRAFQVAEMPLTAAAHRS
jgi:hypothetical protein